MTTVPILDLTISLILIFFLLSIICSGIVEWLNNLTIRQKRQVNLYKSIAQALNDPLNLSWGELLYRHPLVHNMKRKPNRYPVYISSNTFTTVVTEIIIENLYLQNYRRDTTNPGKLIIPVATKARLDSLTPIDKFREGVGILESGQFKTLLESFLVAFEGTVTLDEFKKKLGVWYDDYQDRVTGWYKKIVTKNLFWVAFILAIICNVDTIKIVKSLFHDDDLRNKLVEAAMHTAQNYKPVEIDLKERCPGCTADQYDSLYNVIISNHLKLSDSLSDVLSAFSLPIGWKSASSEITDDIATTEEELAKNTAFMKDTLLLILEQHCYAKSKSDSCANKIDTVKIAQCKCYCRNNIDSCGTDYKEARKLESDKIKNLEVQLAQLKAVAKASKENDEERSITQGLIKGLRELPQRVKVFFTETIPNFWKANNLGFPGFIFSLIGWLLTGFAASKGSVFWFEALMKFTNIRNAGAKPKRTDVN